MSLNVVVPTIGRPEVQRLVDSVSGQLGPEDFITLIWDSEPIEVIGRGPARVDHIINEKPLGFWGHGSRSAWQSKLEGDYILNADDDNWYEPDAIDFIKKTCTEYKLYVFKAVKGPFTIPVTRKVKVGNIDTGCGVYPNLGFALPDWGLEYCGDYVFYNRLSKILRFEFIDKVIYNINDRNDGYYHGSKCICGGTLKGLTILECNRCKVNINLKRIK